MRLSGGKKFLGMLGAVAALSCMTAMAAFAAWEQDSEVWRYRGQDNEIVKSSWVFHEKNIYYVDESGAMVTGSYEVNGRVCIFDESGVLVDDSAPMHAEGLDSQMLETSGATYDMCIAATYRSQQMMNVEEFYSGPDENGEMLWNSVTRATLREPGYIGTENKSMILSNSGYLTIQTAVQPI